MYDQTKNHPVRQHGVVPTKHHRNTMERAIPMNKDITIPAPPESYAEAEASIQFCITSLANTLREKDMSGLDRENLIDQYVRILSTCLWHDVARWRVEELLDYFEKLTDSIEARDMDGTASYAIDLATATLQILAYKTWSKK